MPENRIASHFHGRRFAKSDERRLNSRPKIVANFAGPARHSASETAKVSNGPPCRGPVPDLLCCPRSVWTLSHFSKIRAMDSIVLYRDSGSLLKTPDARGPTEIHARFYRAKLPRARLVRGTD